MNCRNCGEELPIGETRLCHHCGTRQDTYITPRNRTQPKRKTRRSALMSMLSVFFVIAVVCILIPFLRNLTRTGEAKAIAEKFAYLADVEDKSTKEWEDEFSFWVASVAKFKQSYPGDAEGIAEHEEMKSTLLDNDVKSSSIEAIEKRIAELEQAEDRKHGDYAASLAVLQASIARYSANYPEDESNISRFNAKLTTLSQGADVSSGGVDKDAVERLEIIERLINEAKDTIIDFESIKTETASGGEVTLAVRWVNRAALGVENLTLTLMPLDADGNPVMDADGKPAKGAVRTTAYCAAGVNKSSLFTKVWTDARVASCRMHEVRILYADGSEQYLPPEVCEKLWP